MQSFAKSFLNFVDSSPSPFHVCQTASVYLEEAGFVQLHENAQWLGLLKPGGKYYFRRNGSTLVAFCVGLQFQPGNPFKVVGAHTDSPVLRVKPISKRTPQNYEQVGVECYGGGLWHTWFDRDLGIAGRVVLYNGKQSFQQRLVHLDSPILRIPNLAIHLQNSTEREAFKVNKEDNLTPILSLVAEQLNGSSLGTAGNSSEKKKEDDEDKDLDKRHCASLLKAVAKKLGCVAADIVDFELSLCDVQKATLGGINEEFIFSPRLDNQLHCFTSLNAVIEFANSEQILQDDGVSMICLFDHEEVGSDSNEGAGSPILRDSIERISRCIFESFENKKVLLFEEAFRITLAKSILLSADSAHAVHPNYSSKHEQNHQPLMQKGTVIKTNQNQHYATNSITGFLVRELCKRTKFQYEAGAKEMAIPFQEFVVRNDSGCGSTIGPISAKKVGVRVVDIGIPQLSMHSIREQCAVKDLFSNFVLIKAFFSDVTKIDQSLTGVNSL